MYNIKSKSVNRWILPSYTCLLIHMMILGLWSTWYSWLSSKKEKQEPIQIFFIMIPNTLYLWIKTKFVLNFVHKNWKIFTFIFTLNSITIYTFWFIYTFNVNYVCKWICNLPTTILISYGEFRQFCRVFKHVSGREWSSNVQSRRPQCRSYTSNSKPLELQKWRSWGNTFSISTVLSIRESENKIKKPVI